MSDVAAMPADPMTMVGGNQTPATPEKKKKKKKTKVSSVEKAKVILNLIGCFWVVSHQGCWTINPLRARAA